MIRTSNNLEKIVGTTPLSLEEKIERGIWGKREDLYRALMHYRIGGRLDNLIYSLKLSNTEFFPYQFRPLLEFLDSHTNSLLIADEVGLGKTIEACLIWAELMTRYSARRLLVVCPAALCEKWAMEMRSKFGWKPEIINVERLKEVLQQFETNNRHSGIFITSLQGIRPPKGWEKSNVQRASAELARWLDGDLDSDILDLIILDEAHHIRNSNSQSYKIMKLLRDITDGFLCLSATPIQTSEDNLFNIVNLFDSDTFPYPKTLEDLIKVNEPLVRLIDYLASGEATQETFIELLSELRQSQVMYGMSTVLTDQLLQEPPSKKELQEESSRVRLISKLKRLNPLNHFVTRSLKKTVQDKSIKREAKTFVLPMSPSERRYYDVISKAVRTHCQLSVSSTGFAESIAQRQMTSCMKASYDYWLGKEDVQLVDEKNEIFEPLENENLEENNLLQLLKNAVATYDEGNALGENDTKLRKLVETIKKYQEAHPGKKIILFSFYPKFSLDVSYF